MIGRWLAFGVAACVLAAPQMARAEATEIRLAKQFSMGYVQFNILEHKKLIEAHAKAAGLGDIKVTWATFNGPNAMNDALVSGSVDVVAGGVPGLVTLWAKTRGTPQEVRGISALSSQPFLLNTRNPRIKTIKDFTSDDRIALPAVKVSVHVNVTNIHNHGTGIRHDHGHHLHHLGGDLFLCIRIFWMEATE